MATSDSLLQHDRRDFLAPRIPAAPRRRQTLRPKREPERRGRRSPFQAPIADDPKVRRSAAEALARSRSATFVTDPLIELMADEHAEVRRAAIRSLGAYGDARALEPLRKLSRDYLHPEAKQSRAGAPKGSPSRPSASCSSERALSPSA